MSQPLPDQSKPRAGDRLLLRVCTKCGRVADGPAGKRGHRHAEGAGAHGVYYDELTVQARVTRVEKP